MSSLINDIQQEIKGVLGGKTIGDMYQHIVYTFVSAHRLQMVFHKLFLVL